MKKILMILMGALTLGACSINMELTSNDHGMMDHSGMQMQQGISRNSSYSQDPSDHPEAKPSKIVELQDGDQYDMTAQIVSKEIHGTPVKMLAYNGMIPGPLLKVKQGSTITLKFKNETDEETMLHSHGLRLENEFDGTDLTQEPIPVGGSFSYRLNFPDVGLYWYHPHLREDYGQELGLYGNYLVEPEASDYWSPVNRELPLMIDDLLLENGQIAPFSQNTTDHALMGRYGNIMLVNGDTEHRLNVTAGEVVRLYITNASNARPYRFTIPGIQMKLVGGDSGKMEREEFVEAIILSPSERAIIEVSFPKAGSFEILNDNDVFTAKMATIIVAEGQPKTSYANEFQTLRTNDDVSSEIEPFRKYFDQPADKSLRLSLDMGGMMGHMMMNSGEHSIEWEDTMNHMNRNATSETITWEMIDESTGKTNMDIDWTFKKGDVVKIRIANDPNSMHPMQHPIHVHGQRFLVLSTNGTPNADLVWKDTALIATGDTVDLLVEMSNPGKWMIHCHIAEHLAAGMMLGFEVLP